MIVKVHSVPDGRKIIAICDEALLGKIFRQGKRQLDLRSDFYRGEKRTEKQIAEFIREGNMFNLAGEKTIKFAVKNGLISKDKIIRIKNIPHAQAIL